MSSTQCLKINSHLAAVPVENTCCNHLVCNLCQRSQADETSCQFQTVASTVASYARRGVLELQVASLDLGRGTLCFGRNQCQL